MDSGSVLSENIQTGSQTGRPYLYKYNNMDSLSVSGHRDPELISPVICTSRIDPVDNIYTAMRILLPET